MEQFHDAGSIYVFPDRVDIQKLQIKWLKQQMGLVGQESILFNDQLEKISLSLRAIKNWNLKLI